ncbi:MAG: hypothetical protein ABI634_16490, partial [Acidobacteriota bacterium]
ALAAEPSADAHTRQAALRALTGIDAAHATAIATDALGDVSDLVALEAIEVLAAAAHSNAAASTPAFERLTELALDRRRPVGRRIAALAALRGLPAHLLAALDDALTGAGTEAALGDTTWLEPIAAAWIAAADGDKTWRNRLAALFATIVARDGLTRTSPALIRVLTTQPGAAVLVAAAPRTRTKPKPGV